MEKKGPTIVALNGGGSRKKEQDLPSEHDSVLFIDGERVDLESFILSGCTVEGKRVLLTWNTSLDELLSYNSVLNIVVQDKVRDSLSKGHI